MASKTDLKTNLLIEILDQAFDKHAWHGTNLRGSLRGLTVKQLAVKFALSEKRVYNVLVSFKDENRRKPSCII